MRYSRPFSQIGIFHFSLCLVLFALAWGLIYLDGWDFSLKSDNELCYLTLCQQPTTLRVSLQREETSLLIVVGVLNNILYNNHSRSEDLEIYLGHGIYPPNFLISCEPWRGYFQSFHGQPISSTRVWQAPTSWGLNCQWVSWRSAVFLQQCKASHLCFFTSES